MLYKADTILLYERVKMYLEGLKIEKNVPAYAIVGGVPARIIKYRFSEDVIKQLIDLKWWNLPPNLIKTIPYDAEIEEIITYLNQIKGSVN